MKTSHRIEIDGHKVVILMRKKGWYWKFRLGTTNAGISYGPFPSKDEAQSHAQWFLRSNR